MVFVLPIMALRNLGRFGMMFDLILDALPLHRSIVGYPVEARVKR